MEGVEDSEVEVAMGFQELFAACELHAAFEVGAAGQCSEEHAGALAGDLRGA
jgi:hypothetical protein